MSKISNVLSELGVSKVRLAKYLGVSRQMLYNYLAIDDINKWPKDKKVLLLNGDTPSVNIDPSILNPDDKEMIEDLIMIAVNDAVDKAEELKKDRFGSMASAMGLPLK